MTSLNDTVNSMRAVERLSMVGPLMIALRDLVAGVVEIEPALEPEMSAMLDAINETGEATVRAITFLQARMEEAPS